MYSERSLRTFRTSLEDLSLEAVLEILVRSEVTGLLVVESNSVDGELLWERGRLYKKEGVWGSYNAPPFQWGDTWTPPRPPKAGKACEFCNVASVLSSLAGVDLVTFRPKGGRRFFFLWPWGFPRKG